jgi:predicted phage terminase large subunit-like protein
MIQYYDVSSVSLSGGAWYIGEKKLNLSAACDLAFTEGKRSDYTAIVVAGMNEDGQIFLLDIMRFKTSSIPVMADAIRKMQARWSLRSMRVEVGAAQTAVVKEIKRVLASEGVTLYIEEVTRTRTEGTKQERIDMTLLPRYEQGMIWHYRGGNCQTLEEELGQARPAHEDISDAFATAVEKLTPPSRILRANDLRQGPRINTHSRFGGVV